MRLTEPRVPVVALDAAARKAGSDAALARLIGLTAQAVSNWRNGRTSISPEHCEAIERATGVSRKRLRPLDWRRFWQDI